MAAAQPEVFEEHYDKHVDHHIVSVTELVGTYVLLMFGMAATILLSKWDLGAMNNVMAMVIAIGKATLVVLFFMQVRKGSKLTMLWAAVGFIWFLLMFGILTDYVSREWIPSPGWERPIVTK